MKSVTHLISIVLVGTAVLSTAACRSPQAENDVAETGGVEEDRAAVMSLADRYVASYFDFFPDGATYEGIDGADHSRFPDHSLDGIAAWNAEEDEILAALESIDPAGLESDRMAHTTHRFLHEILSASVGFRACRTELWEVSPTWTGWQSVYSFLASIQPVATADERAAAAKRFASLPKWIDDEIANLREGLATGYSAPRHNVSLVIGQVEGLLDVSVEESSFFDPARRAPEDADFVENMRSVVADEVVPAIERYRDFLVNEYMPAARETIAVATNPGGEACYRAAVRYHTSLDRSAEEIHQTGLTQMEAIVDEMRAIGEANFGTTDAPELLALVRQPPYTFESREQIIEYARDAVERGRTAVGEWVGLSPEAEVRVVPYPEFREQSSPGAQYSSAPDDGSRPGTYFINTYQPERQSRAGIEATAFHETYPGHHFQISIAKEKTKTHPVQRYFGSSGFTEGWALYSERLAQEMGIYGSDVDRLGLLSNEALRAARLVVDSGMHVLGWDRQQAIDYVVSHTAETVAQATSEVDRYIAVPGQATAYMLGNLEVRRLRNEAEAALGERFDIREFHDQILQNGAVTLAMLDDEIAAWIEAKLDN